MESAAKNKNLVVLFSNLAALFFLIILRSFVESFFTAAGVSDSAKYVEGSIYVLSGTSGLLFLRYVSVHVPKFVQWLRPGFYALVEGLDTKLEQMSTQMQDMDKKVEKEFKSINTNLYRMDQKIDKIERSKEAKAADVDKLRKIRRSKLVFLEKLSPDLHKFAVLKTNSFMDFVMSIHATGFYIEGEDGSRIPNPRLNIDTIREDIICEALQVKQQGESIMGKDFMAMFCLIHEKKVDEYIHYIKQLLEAGDNYKHDRFQETSESFLSDFLESLHHIYVDYLKGVRADEKISSVCMEKSVCEK